jgi:hypothetical protein
MGLGTSIFLSSIVLGVIALFIATKDRWKWKKIVLWPTVVLVGFGALATAGWWTYSYMESPRQLTELWGIRLGASTSDVMFFKGAPTHNIHEEMWQYETGTETSGRGYVVRFKEGRVRFVAYYGARLWAPAVPGVSIFASPTDILQRLGDPSHVSSSEDRLSRWLSFDRWNVALLMTKDEIKGLAVYAPQHGPIRFTKEYEGKSRVNRATRQKGGGTAPGTTQPPRT